MLITSEALRRRTGPAVVKWFTTFDQQRQFDSIPEALRFALQFNEQQRPTLRIEFATGPAMFGDEINAAEIRQ